MHKRSSGFTIVELLVVIVVIGILATITIVSYTGISNKAILASIQSDLDNSSKQFKIFQVINGGYPDTIDCTIPDSATNKCIKPSGNNTIPAVNGYVRDNTISPQGFCLNVTNGTTSYKITSITYNTPVVGNCVVPPLGQDFTFTGAVQNLSVLSGVNTITIEAWGAQGGGAGGKGGYSKGDLAVTGGSVLYVYVGGAAIPLMVVGRMALVI